MSKLRVHNLVVSLDGFATGEEQSLDAAFGHAQQAFMEWFEKIRIWRALAPDGQLGPDEAIASAWGTAIGAEIMGRNKFRPTTGPWPEDGWRGWWGEDPPFHTPCFVMTHYEREPLTVGGTTFHFVNGTPAEVLDQAQKAAGDGTSGLAAGPPRSTSSCGLTWSTTCTSCWSRSCSAAASGSGMALAGYTSATPWKRSPSPAEPPTCSSPADPPRTRSPELGRTCERDVSDPLGTFRGPPARVVRQKGGAGR